MPLEKQRLCSLRNASLALAMPLLLAACVIATPPDRAELTQQALVQTQLPPNWKFAKTPGEFDAEALGFVLPPELSALIREAQANNLDLRLAATRVEQARSAMTIAGAPLLPTVGIGAQAGSSAIPTSSLAVNGLALVANWEIDVWGKTRLNQAFAHEQTLAAALDTLYLRQSISAAVVKAWLTAVELSRQIQVFKEIIALSEKQVVLIQAGQKVGRDTQQDVVVNQLAVKANRSQLLQAEQALNSARRAFEVLIGRYPAAEIAVAAELPLAPNPIAVGLPSELAERRPDLQAAESRFRAAFYNVEAAQRARLPSISLVAGISFVDENLLALQQGLSNPIAAISGRLLAPLFTAGALDAQVEIKTAQQQEATIQYARTLLNALNEIEGALYADQMLADRYTLELAQYADQEMIVEFQRVQMKVGKGNMYQLQQQQLSLTARKLNLLRLQNERLIQRVNLHLALGGIYQV